jgi:hypothetical protein
MVSVPISVILHLFCFGAMCAFAKADVEICARAKDASVSGDYDAFYARVDVEHCVGGFDFLAHGVGEGIVLLGAVEREDYHRGLFFVVFGLDLSELQVVVGRGEVDVGFVAGRLVAAWGHGCD